MSNFSLTAHYPTEGEDAYEWGIPEARLEEILYERPVEIIGVDYGTDLVSGVRDVWLEVIAASAGVLEEAIDMLPSSDRSLWKIEAMDDEEEDEE